MSSADLFGLPPRNLSGVLGVAGEVAFGERTFAGLGQQIGEAVALGNRHEVHQVNQPLQGAIGPATILGELLHRLRGE